MNIIGFSIREIRAGREENIPPKISVSNNIKIKNVGEDEIKELGKKCVKIDYEFAVTYTSQNKRVGEIKISGALLGIGKDIKKSLDRWKREKKLTEEHHFLVLNTVLRRCLIKAMEIAEDMQMPAPFPLPVVPRQKLGEETKYIR